jgi:predicted YcjX-like family ATPase
MAEKALPSSSQLPVSYHAVASVLSTVDSTARIEGRPVEVVLGLPLGEERQKSFYPDDVPSGRPPDSFWSDRFFELPIFVPPRIDPSGAAGIPHLGIDEVMIALLRDVF